MSGLIFSVQPSLVGRNVERLRQQVLKRDGHQCVFCRITSHSGMDVIYSDDSHKTTLEGCSTACSICTATVRGGIHAGANAGFMVYMPELTQAQISGLFQALSAWSTIVATVKQRAIRTLEEKIDHRRALVEEITGATKAYHVSHWRKLLESNQKLYSNRSDILGPFRFMPDATVFKHELETWKSDIFSRYDEDSIRALVTKVGGTK